uniref:Uncharacterized protein n=1 Tax=Catagonus wagneri TaxID=51154 RepID=A0A8C3WRV9_9CETA
RKGIYGVPTLKISAFSEIREAPKSPAQAAPDINGILEHILEKVKAFRYTLQGRWVIKQSNIPAKIWHWFSGILHKAKEGLDNTFS